MYTKCFIGPSKKKSWRNMIQSNASGNNAPPTCASGNDDAQQPCESEGSQVEDPDMMKKTRNGKIYHAHITPGKFILKVSPSSHHGQDILKFSITFRLSSIKRVLHNL
eukprot:TRINITY_DN68986_c0_g1_i1.p1 TRINITY_DN68986_c0_g1~~TRINITY_DN68986_c0_g1_i1.p1  ORF type:complete len:108 (-),score=16.38 TRINITY_DN68986_c0_g1_i1:77-400(-)